MLITSIHHNKFKAGYKDKVEFQYRSQARLATDRDELKTKSHSEILLNTVELTETIMATAD